MPTSTFEDSVSLWLEELKQGDEDAANKLWIRFFPQLLQAAQRKINGAARRVADEEDVVVSIFQSLCLGAREGRYDHVGNREELWKLLVSMAGKKAIDEIRRQTALKRGGGQVRGDSVMSDHSRVGLDLISGGGPTPEFMAMFEEYQRQLFERLPSDAIREIARLRIEGYENREIASQLGVSLRSVERKVGVIRDCWVE